MKLLYLTTWDFSNEESDGVCKKIYSHIKTFKENGYHVDFIFIKDKRIVYCENDQIYTIGRVGNIKKTLAYVIMYKFLKYKRYDWVYNRYGMMDTFYYRVLKRLKMNGAKVLVEIPTYPYTEEIPKGFLFTLMAKWDQLYEKKIQNCVDKIITFSKDDEIFGVKTIKIVNGIDFEDYSLVMNREKKNSQEFNMIAVANVMNAHGYDRIIRGIHNYVRNKSVPKVIFHIIGSGSILEDYKTYVKDNCLDEYVKFHGRMNKEEMIPWFEISDVAIESIGDHRVGIDISSSLKSREYVARGIPFVTSCVSDVFEGEFFVYKVTATNEAVDIKKIQEYVAELYADNSRVEIAKTIRNKGKMRCDISKTMIPIFEYMNEESH